MRIGIVLICIAVITFILITEPTMSDDSDSYKEERVFTRGGDNEIEYHPDIVYPYSSDDVYIILLKSKLANMRLSADANDGLSRTQIHDYTKKIEHIVDAMERE